MNLRKIFPITQKYFKLLCLAAAFFQPSIASANWIESLFGYGSFEECILDRMQGVTSDQAARLIIIACRNLTKSDDEETSSTNQEMCPKLLTSEQRRGVSGQSRIASRTKIYMDLYNASRDFSISYVEVRITGKSGDTAFERELILRGAYDIFPLSTDTVMGDLGLRDLSGLQVMIVAVYGCEA
jgi:hypothetical protein